MHFNKVFLMKGLIPLAACSALTACVDDNYDLTDIDTTSRFTVNNLTVPVNLSEIKLKDVVNLDDNENISKIMLDGNEVYAIQKGGSISTEDFSISGIHVNSPSIPSTNVNILIGDLPNIPGMTTIPETTFTVPLSDIPEQSYDILMDNVDAALLRLDNVKTKNPIHVEVLLKIPASMMSGNQIKFKNLTVKMPWGLMCDNTVLNAACPGASYNPKDGILSIPELQVNSNGQASLPFEAFGLDLKSQDKGDVINQKLNIDGNVGIMSGDIELKLTNLNIPNPFTLNVDYSVSSFDIKSFSGTIDYKMDNINIAPISLNDLPDFLDSPETVITIANPAILVDINNPVGDYKLSGSGVIALTSNFKDGKSTVTRSGEFTIGENGAKLSFCTSTDGYQTVNFDGLRYILNGTGADAEGLPNSINVNLENIRFSGNAVDFPIGSSLGNADGQYDFTAPLGFGAPSKVVYETTENGWGSEDLDDVNIQRLHLTAKCTTNLPVAVKLNVVPVDKNGNSIDVKELKELVINPNKSDESIDFVIEAIDEQHPISGFDGVRFRAIISQDYKNNTQAIGPDLNIIIKEIRATVDGYYETDF